MIINYSSDYFDFFSKNVSEFDVSFLNGDSPFLKNFVYLENDIPVIFGFIKIIGKMALVLN